jgi:CRP-like cAMP-binding protein
MRQGECPAAAADLPSRACGRDVARGRMAIPAPNACLPTVSGDKGNNFYLIKAGTCEVSVNEEDGSVLTKHLGPGGSCGELALLTGNPRSATVTVRPGHGS